MEVAGVLLANDLFYCLYFLFMDPCKCSPVVFSNGLAYSLSDEIGVFGLTSTQLKIIYSPLV